MTDIRIGRVLALAAGLSAATAFSPPAMAIEPGEVSQTPGGLDIGPSANIPDPGIYMANKLMTYQAKLVGLGAPANNGFPNRTSFSINLDIQKFLIVPGWTFLGGRYSAVIAQPFANVAVGNPVNVNFSGMHNTFIIPGQLSYNLGGGFFADIGLGMYVPDGTISGPKGINNVGAPYWTFQPQVVLSYLNDGWNLTANMYEEFNTKNMKDGYTTGDILHGDFTATKKIGRWTFGPVAYFTDQVTSDTTSPMAPINGGRFADFAIGGLLGYDFGPAAANVVVTDEVYAKTMGGSPGVGNTFTEQGFKVFGELSYKLYDLGEAPDTSKRPMVYK